MTIKQLAHKNVRYQSLESYNKMHIIEVSEDSTFGNEEFNIRKLSTKMETLLRTLHNQQITCKAVTCGYILMMFTSNQYFKLKLFTRNTC